MQFEFFLALELKKTRAELRRSMSGSEFAGWMAYYRRRHRDETRAREQAEDKAEGERVARSMRGFR